MKDRSGMKSLVLLGGIFGFLAVVMGGFGAHALKARISPDMMQVYQTGAHYHLAHALALLLVGLLAERWRGNRLIVWSGRLFALGIVLFSGSLYALAISGIRILGAVTPIGGLCFLAGWALIVAGAVQEPRA